MENDEMLSERQSIRESARQLKKYGSTCNHVRNNEYLIRHNLEQTDTLQGIALKYGCTTEQIRRVNRLFAQDSLFLRQYLMIPVDRDTSLQHNQQSKSLSSPINSPIDEQPFASASTSTALAPFTSFKKAATTPSNTKHDKNQPILSPEEENKRSIEDFLGKIDSTLAKTKNYVKNSQSSLNGISIDNNDDELDGSSYGSGSSTVSTAFGFTRSYQNIGGTNSSSNNHNQTAVKRSLDRLEEQQDEFYQL